MKKQFKFEEEIKLLDKVYSDMMEAIHNKPSDNTLENLRLYADNVYVLLNRTALRVNELKNNLLEDRKLFLETFNPPA